MVSAAMTSTVAPPVLWAQRKGVVYITFAVHDLKNQKVCVFVCVFSAR